MNQPPPATEAGPPADASRSGESVVEGVEAPAKKTKSAGVAKPPKRARPRKAPVEQVKGDPDLTEGRAADGPGESDDSGVEVPSGAMPEAPASGGAQSMPGARVSDQPSASGDRPAAGPDDADSLDALALARTVVSVQLQRPQALAGVVGAIALVAYGLGRRSGRRAR